MVDNINNELEQFFLFVSDLISLEEFYAQINNLKKTTAGLIEDSVVTYMILTRYNRQPTVIAKLKNLEPGGFATINCMVNSIDPKREFIRKDGKTGTVITLNVEDTTGRCRIILWDTRLQEHVENNIIKQGTYLLVINARYKETEFGSELTPVKNNGLRILDEGDVKFWNWLMARDYDNKADKNFREYINIKDLYEGIDYSRVDVKGTVKEKGTLKEFMRKKGTKGYVINYRIYDGTGEAIITLWDSMAQEHQDINIGDIVMLENGRPKEREGMVEIHSSYNTKLIIN